MQVKTVILPKWYWKMLGDCNGFSGQERINGWRLNAFLRNQGILPKAKDLPCEICSSTLSSNHHSENYYIPWNPHVLCRPCHFALHNRLKGKWNEWQELINKHSKTQDEWFMKLSSEKIDMAVELREKHGDDVAYIIKNCRLIPEGIKILY